MKNLTNKEKGDNFENFVLSIINEEIDPKAERTPASGAKLFKGDIYSPKLNARIECKDHKQLSVGKWIEQLKQENRGEHNIGMIVFRDPKSPLISPTPYCLIDLSSLIQMTQSKALLAEIQSDKQENRQLIWKIERFVTNCKELIKELKK